MTLDDAIVAFGQLVSDNFDNLELDVRDYERLVNWLTELKLARESASSDIGLAARAISENNKLKAENDKLRELARDLRFCARQSICLKCKHGRICDLRLDERCAELGIEVDE